MSEFHHHSAFSRRSFLVSLAGAAATFGFTPGEVTAQGSVASPFEPTIWYSIDYNGIVTVNIIRAEMGQHVGTAIARILADELEINWSNVRISAVDTAIDAPVGESFGNIPLDVIHQERFERIHISHGGVQLPDESDQRRIRHANLP